MKQYLLYAFLGFWGLWFIWYMTGGPLRDTRKSPFINVDPASGSIKYASGSEVKKDTVELKNDLEAKVK